MCQRFGGYSFKPRVQKNRTKLKYSVCTKGFGQSLFQKVTMFVHNSDNMYVNVYIYI